MSQTVLFGSIGTLVDTSELQRASFNQAFAQHGLDWHWSRDEYIPMLQKSGGRQRIANYAESVDQTVDADAIHQTKSNLFQQTLQNGGLVPRSGVQQTIEAAKSRGFKIGLVTTTSKENVKSMLSALKESIDARSFDLIVTRADVDQPKPAPDAYAYSLKKLSIRPEDCVAIEDNLGGVQAATAAGLLCIAFPGENTDQHEFESTNLKTHSISLELIERLLSRTPV